MTRRWLIFRMFLWQQDRIFPKKQNIGTLFSHFCANTTELLLTIFHANFQTLAKKTDIFDYISGHFLCWTNWIFFKIDIRTYSATSQIPCQHFPCWLGWIYSNIRIAIISIISFCFGPRVRFDLLVCCFSRYSFLKGQFFYKADAWKHMWVVTLTIRLISESSPRLWSSEGITGGAPTNKSWNACSSSDRDKADTILNPSQISGGDV